MQLKCRNEIFASWACSESVIQCQNENRSDGQVWYPGALLQLLTAATNHHI